MDGHQIWMQECAKINFEAAPKRYKEGTRTSEDAARQLQCDVSNIAKSIVFEGQDVAIIVITSGSNRVDRKKKLKKILGYKPCLLYTSPSPRDRQKSRMPSSA